MTRPNSYKEFIQNCVMSGSSRVLTKDQNNWKRSLSTVERVVRTAFTSK